MFGDPEKVPVPVQRLLADQHPRVQARLAEEAAKQGKPLPAQTDGRPADGTIHLSAADAQGNLAALTLTHGGAFGAQVTLEHGMADLAEWLEGQIAFDRVAEARAELTSRGLMV